MVPVSHQTDAEFSCRLFAALAYPLPPKPPRFRRHNPLRGGSSLVLGPVGRSSKRLVASGVLGLFASCEFTEPGVSWFLEAAGG